MQGLLGLAALFGSGPAFAGYASTPWGDAGPMQDIDIGADGDVFGIARGSINGSNGHIFRWIHGEWRQFTTGYGIRVAVDNAGRPWHINAAGSIYRWVGRRWRNVPGAAVSIDIGPNNEVFIVRTNRRVAKYNGSTFVDYGGFGDEITVDQEGLPWVLSGSGIWQHNGSSWRRHTSLTARDIDAGANGEIYALQASAFSDGIAYVYNPRVDYWLPTSGVGARLAVAPTNAPAFITSGGDILSHFVRRVHGRVSCDASERDCNVCAYDVRGQFKAMFDHGHRTSVDRSWRMNWLSTYPPSNRTAVEAFDDATLVISAKHVQGFVKTRNAGLPFAGSYSDNRLGSLFTVTNSSNLRHIVSSGGGEKHPSGIHALGDWVAVNENDTLRFQYLPTPSMAPLLYPAPAGSALGTSGGGLGVARLPDDNGSKRFVVVSTNPGGNLDWGTVAGSGVWELQGAIDGPATELVYLGGNPHQLSWGNFNQTNENLSLITECETGQIYGVHTSGDYDLYGDGFWRLSRLEQGTAGPVLRGLDVFTEGQNEGTCHLRSAATAFVEPGGHITTYCHARDATRESRETWENVNYTERRPNYANSCVARCGARAPGGCWCDSLCEGYGDCCNDAATHCDE